jgi:hypothetical protein
MKATHRRDRNGIHVAPERLVPSSRPPSLVEGRRNYRVVWNASEDLSSHVVESSRYASKGTIN